MRVLINDHAYEIGRKAFRGVLDIAKKSVPHGIYAVSKDDFCEMKKRNGGLVMENKTCETCVDNDFGLCDRLGVLVENDDSCEKHREKTVERYEREGDQRLEKKAMR